MKNVFFMVFLICCLFAMSPIVTNAGSEAVKERPPVSEETEICIECHRTYSPGIVEDWLKSRHAAVTPEDAVKKPAAERRVSAQRFPDNAAAVAVGCYECHGLNADAHQDNFEHVGLRINMIVSPNDCGTCHPVEVDQYMDSKKAHAVDILRKNPVYTTLVETVIGLKSAHDGKILRAKASESTEGETCYACHGTDIKVEGMRTVSTDVGDMEFPVLSGWPNQGVGRLNPDGSRGSCASCHPRHGFSIEVARKPYTCSQCHLEPDVPAWNVYKESKHGNIYFSKHDDWEWDAVPWKLGKDFTTPTCSACHNSLVTTPEGRTIMPRTHNFGDRLWVRAFGLIYSHPQPEKGDTYKIKNKDGLPLPVTFSGEPASEYLISPEEQTKRQDAMENFCKSCHGSTWVSGHFSRMDKTFVEVDKMVAAATQLMSEAWESGLADNSNPFDESIEHKWIKQWLFYASSVRYASAMTGAPDYAAFKNGWWNLTTNLQEMQSLVALKSGSAELPPEAIAGVNEVITETAELAGTATLFVDSKPDGASVYIDDKPMGKTPCTIKVDVGVKGRREVRVAVLKDGYKTKRAKVMLIAGKQTEWGDINLMEHVTPPKDDQESISPQPLKESEKDSAPTDDSFGSIDLSELSERDKQYLGLKDNLKPILKNVDSDLIIFEFLSVYCTSCQMQSPIFNDLYSAIEKDASLRSRVKMVGLGVGNNQREVERFKEERKITFPILTDPKFAEYERLVNSMRTPYTLLLKKDRNGDLTLAGSHMGLIRSYESYLTEIEAVLQYSEDVLEEKQSEELAKDVTRATELKLSEEELMAKVKESMVRVSGDENIRIVVKRVPAQKESKVYEGISGNVKHFAVVVSRESVCDICHAIQFIYVFDEKGVVVEFEPIHLTKYGNKDWNEYDIEKMRQRVLGKSILQPMSFNPEVDAVTSATITSAIIFKALSQGRDVFRFVIK